MAKMRRRCNAFRAGASAAIMGLLLAGCADDSSDARPVQGEAATASATPAPHGDSPGALAAYRAMWKSVVAAARVSDPGHARLDDHARGEALGVLRFMMRENKKQGVSVRGDLRIDPGVAKRTVDEVVIGDCIDDSRWLQYGKDGVLKNDVPGGHHRVDATVRRQHGQWNVEKLYIDEVGTC
ncbi:hypothetical protein ACFWZ2_37500 [Streptomyces sp. NPDC059002]|uniref:hypothetical protein n=1 Tax=Streptomyces sp. NPDC059002 TaxID=3346690 RepID=UPI00368AD2D2